MHGHGLKYGILGPSLMFTYAPYNHSRPLWPDVKRAETAPKFCCQPVLYMDEMLMSIRWSWRCTMQLGIKTSVPYQSQCCHSWTHSSQLMLILFCAAHWFLFQCFSQPLRSFSSKFHHLLTVLLNLLSSLIALSSEVQSLYFLTRMSLQVACIM